MNFKNNIYYLLSLTRSIIINFALAELKIAAEEAILNWTEEPANFFHILILNW